MMGALYYRVWTHGGSVLFAALLKFQNHFNFVCNVELLKIAGLKA